MDARLLAKLYGGARFAVGAALLLTPTLAARPWIGADADRDGTRVVLRALGIRDLALGAGLIDALANDRPVGPWLDAGTSADLVDAVASAAVGRERSPLAILTALSGAGMGIYLRSRLPAARGESGRTGDDR